MGRDRDFKFFFFKNTMVVTDQHCSGHTRRKEVALITKSFFKENVEVDFAPANCVFHGVSYLVWTHSIK